MMGTTGDVGTIVDVKYGISMAFTGWVVVVKDTCDTMGLWDISTGCIVCTMPKRLDGHLVRLVVLTRT